MVLTTILSTTSGSNKATSRQYPVKSGIKMWVDPSTPDDRQTYMSSRGRLWELVMSDEFNTPDRDFRPGKDHLWTSIEKPDGVNGALEVYNHNMTSTQCDENGTCYFYIKVIDEEMHVRVFKQYRNPPSYVNQSFHYRGGMVQTWNKFCFQGGMMEARVQLPGAVSKESGNPDLAKGINGAASANAYYPTWPGIWTMGNLGRAIFSASTNRMWPFSYNRCEPEIFEVRNQRINACDKEPGYGLNPNQGRGAPEIDLLEGAGTLISSSLQIAPGMPPEFRLEIADKKIDKDDYYTCMYGGTCKTIGANCIDVPTAHFKKRGHVHNWYKGLRYAGNPYCQPDIPQRQSYAAIVNSLNKGIVENTCSLAICPASRDVNADLGFIDGNENGSHWGINANGTCFPLINAYIGSYLCDPDNQNTLCSSPRNDTTRPTNIMKPFNYQMDALSANWPVQVGAYTDYLVYQFEWVTGVNGYIRWMLNGHPIFEVTSETIMNVPQGTTPMNPIKHMIEEPMSIIMNVALSSSWGTQPPNAGRPCRGDGKDPKVQRICDSFPMYMKVDYIRLYQDKGTDRDKDNYMEVGCDPETHPTREWIAGHLDEYTDENNRVIEVAGKAFCTKHDDCTVALTTSIQFSRLVTGKCVNGRCACMNGDSWGGPRCSVAKAELQTTKGAAGQIYGPPVLVALAVAGVTYFLTSISLWHLYRNAKAQVAASTKTIVDNKDVLVSISQSPRASELHMKPNMVIM